MLHQRQPPSASSHEDKAATIVVCAITASLMVLAQVPFLFFERGETDVPLNYEDT
jgi:hypothetical protein